MIYLPPLFDLVPQLGYWPEEDAIDNSDIGLPFLPRAAWRLDLCRDGTLSLRKEKEKSFNGVAIPVYRHDDEKVLREVQTLMCRLAYERDERLTHEDGSRWIFSWLPLTGTLWQVEAVQRIIHTFVTTDDAKAAYAEAERLGKIVEAAYNAHINKTEATA